MLLKLIKKIKTSSRGTAAIEFSFMMPIMVILSFGFFEVSRALFTQVNLDYSAAQASRYAMVNFAIDKVGEDYISGIEADIQAFAEESYILVDKSQVISFDVNVVVDTTTLTKTVSINIDYPFSIIIPLVSFFDYTITGSSDSFLIR